MERVLERKYHQVLNDTSGIWKTYPGAYSGVDLPNYTREVSDFIQHHDTTDMTNLLDGWYDGGRKKMAELVQGLQHASIGDILAYYNKVSSPEPVYRQ